MHVYTSNQIYENTAFSTVQNEAFYPRDFFGKQMENYKYWSELCVRKIKKNKKKGIDMQRCGALFVAATVFPIIDFFRNGEPVSSKTCAFPPRRCFCKL